MCDFWRMKLFCLGYHFSKHKTTIYSKHFWGHDLLCSLATLMNAAWIEWGLLNAVCS